MEQLSIESRAFSNEQAIPEDYTCDGRDVSPPLSWGGVPKGTRSLALIMEDPDAPDPKAPAMTWYHWVVFNIPPTSKGLSEAITAEALPVGAVEGPNSWGRRDYGGPCPPVGRHRYYFRLYALDTVLDLDKPTGEVLHGAVESHVLAEGVLMGTYERS